MQLRIIWTKSLAFRRTAEYKQKYDVARWNNGPADTICLSYTHDEDYEELIPKHLKFQMRGAAESGADDSHIEGPEASDSEYTWLRVCAADELQDGKGCAVSPLHLGRTRDEHLKTNALKERMALSSCR